VSATAIHAPAVTASDRLGLTLFFTALLHALLILGVSFSPPQRKPLLPSLDVLLVQRPSAQAPDQAEFLAQANQQGSGTQLESRPAAGTPLKQATRLPTPPPTPAQQPQPAAGTRQARVSSSRAKRAAPKPSEEAPAPGRRLEISEEVVQRAALNSELSSDITSLLDAYHKRPRILDISASSARAASHAAYMRAWVDKVERIGNLNYPDEARRRRLAGQLVLAVSLRPDGSVKDIDLLRSSGQQALDDAALRIVRLSAPFSAFPPEMRREGVDILRITRTWEFQSSARLTSR
jgi:protein TonB